MKKPNYGFEKRQKEIRRQKKNEEKRLRKFNKANPPAVPVAGGGAETPPVV